MPRWDINLDLDLNLSDRELINYIVEIEAYKLSVLKIPLPPRLNEKIDHLNIIRQIKGTTGIEGNTLTEEEISTVLDDVKNKNNDNKKTEEQEIKNSWEVLNFIKRYAKEHNSVYITEDLIKEIHCLTTKDCQYNNNICGAYRNNEVTAGEYLAPDHQDVPGLMSKFIDFINSRYIIENCRPIIRAIIAHFYLVSIHPFGDGNGRTSRGIEAYILYQGNYNIKGFYSLANFYYRNRQEYVNQLQKARFIHNGTLTEFVKFSLKGYIIELQEVQEMIISFVRKIMFKDYTEELLRSEDINYRIKAILDYMVNEEKVIKVDEMKAKAHYLIKALYENINTSRTIIRDIDLMKRHNLIKVENNALYPNISIMYNL